MNRTAVSQWGYDFGHLPADRQPEEQLPERSGDNTNGIGYTRSTGRHLHATLLV